MTQSVIFGSFQVTTAKLDFFSRRRCPARNFLENQYIFYELFTKFVFVPPVQRCKNLVKSKLENSHCFVFAVLLYRNIMHNNLNWSTSLFVAKEDIAWCYSGLKWMQLKKLQFIPLSYLHLWKTVMSYLHKDVMGLT